jgi:small subunit ribosomal protein S7
VPVEVPYQRGQTLALRWIIQYARERKGKPMYIKLAEQLIETARGEGPVIKKKETTHKMAEANQAFAYYRW